MYATERSTSHGLGTQEVIFHLYLSRVLEEDVGNKGDDLSGGFRFWGDNPHVGLFGIVHHHQAIPFVRKCKVGYTCK